MSDRVTVYSKLDIKSLAIIGEFLSSEGAVPKNQSDLVNKAVKVLANHLVHTDLASPILSRQGAIEQLKEIGITWDRGSRGRKDIETSLKGKPDASVVQDSGSVPRTESGGLDLDELKKEASEVRKGIGNQGGGTEGEVAPPDPSKNNSNNKDKSDDT